MGNASRRMFTTDITSWKKWCEENHLLIQAIHTAGNLELVDRLEPRPNDYKSLALPTELYQQMVGLRGIEPGTFQL